MSSRVRWLTLLIASLAAASASAQVPFPKQNANGPIPPYRQDAFPYPGQCTASTANWYVGGPPMCNDPAWNAAHPDAAAAGYGNLGNTPAIGLGTKVALSPTAQPKFRWEMPNPVDFTPEKVGFCSSAPTVECKFDPAAPAASAVTGCPQTTDTCGNFKYDYYRLRIARVTNIQALATLGIFPNPGITIPDGTTWTGIVNGTTPLFTPVWGFGQLNGSAITTAFVSWPSMSLRGQRGTPVIVDFVNQTPDQHLLCPYPLAWDVPCAIDRTLMGLKPTIDPARNFNNTAKVPTDGLNVYGSPQQPDNAFTIHLHGGEIPPQSDGFAEKWFGNTNSAAAYASLPRNIDPIFEAPYGTIGSILRPTGNSMSYYYPMVNGESTIWYHDHALGKTRINVVAGPAGFAPVEDAADAWHAPLAPLAAKNSLGVPMYDLFVAIQDRSFNSDGTINFPTGLGQPIVLAKKAVAVPGQTPVTPGNNPQVHPQWVGEYFADHITVNGVIWPKVTVQRGVYRMRLLNGSNARCYQLGFGTVAPVIASAAAAGTVTRNMGFQVIADEQGYLPAPVAIAPTAFLQMCPGERYEILVDFSAVPAGSSVWMTNTAAAPFPVGITPQQKGSIFAETAQILKFTTVGSGTAAGRGETAPVAAASIVLPARPALTGIRAMPACPTNSPNCYSAVRQMYLNERIDGVTLTSLGLQINGVPFEYKVTETPQKGTYERWDIVNTTGDFHPMHLHLVRFLVVQRRAFALNGYTSALCGLNKCGIFGGGAGGVMQVVPDVNLFYGTNPVLAPAPEESGWKDTVQAPPGQVTTVIAKWDGSWTGADGACAMNFPNDPNYPSVTYNATLPLCFEPVTNAPYVWHCHIVDHEDAEMMRSSLVMK
jgi:FtsP/CotA-like multicopper oxidase with cupredoxin domain